jgi:outer membrane protein assembly factor BamD (BamD/ComL family)
MANKGRALLILVSFAGSFVAAAAALSEPCLAEGAASYEQSEAHERDVDQAALISQDQAASEAGALMKQYRGTEQEPLLLFRFAEIQQQSAEMKFRIAHKGGAGDLSRYRDSMRQSIPALDRLIQVYPRNPDMARALYLRAKAHQETANVAAARRDYLRVGREFPAAPEAIPSWMALADIASDAGQYRDVLSCLAHVQSHPESAHYPYALYKSAWAHHNLNAPGAALEASRRLVAYFQGRARSSDELNASDRSLLESAQLDSAVFFFEGRSRGLPGYGHEQALSAFRALSATDASGEVLGRICARYAKLLRAQDDEAGLASWRTLIAGNQPARADAIEVVVTSADYFKNKQRYDELARAGRELVRMHEAAGDAKESRESFQEARKILLEASGRLQKRLVEYKGTPQAAVIGAQLDSIYDSFTHLVGEGDPRLAMIHSNQAETLFSIGEFEKATAHYRWLSSHSEGKAAESASLKAIGSRYEALRARHLVPGELKARAIPASEPRKTDPQAEEWVGWIDAHRKQWGGAENFNFEANRTLYAQGQVSRATGRLREFAIHAPRSPFAVPSATLVVDTLIASRDWQELGRMSREFASIAEWKSTSFATRLQAMAAQAHYKRIQELAGAHQYKEAMSEASSFARLYPTHEYVPSALALAGNSALALNDRDTASAQYALIVNRSPRSRSAGEALLAMARLEEDRYAFGEASRHYLSYLALPAGARDPKSDSRLRHRALTLGWLSGERALIDRLLSDRSACSGASHAECERYAALRTFVVPGAVSVKPARAAALSQSAPKGMRAIWAAIALNGVESLNGVQRQSAVRALARHWQDLDASSQLILLASISESVPRSFQMERATIQKRDRLSASERSLARRLKLIRSMEASAAEAARLPWARIRALVLIEVAGAYSDLSAGVRTLPSPRRMKPAEQEAYSRMVAGLVRPFEEKAHALSGRAFQLVSATGTDAGTYDRVAHAYFVGQVAVAPRQVARQKLDLTLLEDSDDQKGWNGADLNSARSGQALRARWSKAIESGAWQQVAFFIQEARSKGLLKPRVSAIAEAVSLAAAGAQAEGWGALADARPRISTKSRKGRS